MTEAMEAMRSNIGLRFAAQKPGIEGEMQTASRIIAEKRGLAIPSADDLARIQLDIMRGMGQYGDKDQLTENIKQQRRLRTQTELAGLRDVEGGLGVAGARTELAATVDRVSAALVELNRQQEAMREQLRASADAQNAFAAGVANFGMMLGGEGSAEQQLRRFEINRAASLRGRTVTDTHPLWGGTVANAPGRD
jgi:hypothetical protein